MRSITSVGLLAASLLLVAPDAFGHGGNHPLPTPGPVWGPSGPKGPSYKGPVGNPASTPAGPPSATAPSTGAGPQAGGPAPIAPSTGPTGGQLDGFDLTLWTFWWEFNREPYLALKQHLFSALTTTGSEEFFQGEGSRDGSVVTLRPDPELVERLVVPALLRALEDGGHNDVVTGAMIALARIGRSSSEEARARIADVLVALLASNTQEVAETAALSLGILGRERSAPLLASLLSDEEPGRKAAGRKAVPQRTRAFAAYALGLVAHRSTKPDVRRYAVIQLQRALDEDEGASPDVGVACVLALGVIPLPVREADDESEAPDGTRDAQVRYLLAHLDDERAHRSIRAQVPISLARLLEDLRGEEREALKSEVAGDLLRRVSARSKEPREVMQGVVLALGGLGDDDGDALDVRIRKALIGIEDATTDVLARNLALISLAQVGARAGSGKSEGRKDCQKQLLRQIVRGNTSRRAWSAIALGVFGRGIADAGDVPDDELAKALRDYLEQAHAPDDVGGAALAVGLLRQPGAGEELLRQLERTRDDQARGYVGLGLGLAREYGAILRLQELLGAAKYHPVLLREVAAALVLLGDRQALPGLVNQLRESKSLASQASVAAALGRIGDSRSIAPLLDVLRDEKRTALARAFAAIALGNAGDQDVLPWSTIYAVGANYGSAPATLYSLSGGGLLNIL